MAFRCNFAGSLGLKSKFPPPPPWARNHSKRGMTFKSSIRSNQKVRIPKVSGSSAPDVLFTRFTEQNMGQNVRGMSQPIVIRLRLE